LKNWRIEQTLFYVVLAFVAAGLISFAGINLEEKAFGFIAWKWLLLAGVGYSAWVFNKLIHI